MAKMLKDKLAEMISDHGLMCVLLAMEEIYGRKAHDHEVAGNEELGMKCRKVAHLVLDMNAETCHWKL